MSSLFDRDVLHRRVTRALPHWSQHDFIHQQTASVLRDRLLDIKRDFATVLEIGWQPCVVDTALRSAKQIATVDTYTPIDMTKIDVANDMLPVTPHSYDAVLSQLVLHNLNDPAVMLQQYFFALQPDGVFVGCVLGGDSLQELRDVLAEAEQEMYGGVSPRVHPMLAVQDMAGLLQTTGFALPVADVDRVIVTYTDLKTLLADLRGLGQSNVLRRRRMQPVGKRFWQRVERLYHERYSDARGRLIVTLDVIYLLGWAPHPSQPQPKARGSATVQLGTALKR